MWECCGSVEVDNGFRICTSCGKCLGRHLETSLTSFNHGSLYFPTGYSRKSRFEKKVLGALRCMSAHKVDEDLMSWLEARKITTPQQLLQEMSRFPTNGRRPYIYVMYYWKALGFQQPVVLAQDMEYLKREFDHIFFAWERLGFENPKFPYSFTFRKLVTGNPKYSQGMRDLVPFVRKLRCHKRRKRYNRLFAICHEFDFKKIVYKQKQMDEKMDEKIDENEVEDYPATIVYAHEVTKTPHTKSVYECRGVYKTKQDVADAFKNDEFDPAKTMHIAPDGTFYFLQWKEESKKKDKEFERNRAKLEEMLREQSKL